LKCNTAACAFDGGDCGIYRIWNELEGVSLPSESSASAAVQWGLEWGELPRVTEGDASDAIDAHDNATLGAANVPHSNISHPNTSHTVTSSASTAPLVPPLLRVGPDTLSLFVNLSEAFPGRWTITAARHDGGGLPTVAHDALEPAPAAVQNAIVVARHKVRLDF